MVLQNSVLVNFRVEGFNSTFAQSGVSHCGEQARGSSTPHRRVTVTIDRPDGDGDGPAQHRT
ncbi:hypothetical protein CY34DRAFT_805103 [Suillus luteus UH-Slu-Lm8-n1]|uniref:Uncharacterized protein n=1 Tax=Suillus luteus UH-Slu-Lm8-n1 TaxID=930992 RepID=A0A0D0BG78_9AGAM|nr:hypothetical protein CY34DRAFT_805103 [Suillus luteus UH-Slu-Lm8-n1]